MFDVGRSSFKTTPYGINATRKRVQNNIAHEFRGEKIGVRDRKSGSRGGRMIKNYNPYVSQSVDNVDDVRFYYVDKHNEKKHKETKLPNVLSEDEVALIFK